MSEKGVSSHAARRSPSDDPEQDFGGASPTISIGLPVWNGARYLADAIESILSQTFTDFELIISDNASTDDTAQIAQNFAERDRRIRYHRNEENIGGARNENLTFELSRGRYFRLSAYDDLVEPTLLERCVETLEQDPDAVLCFPETLVIDERGEVTHAEANTRGTASSPSQRFANLHSAITRSTRHTVSSGHQRFVNRPSRGIIPIRIVCSSVSSPCGEGLRSSTSRSSVGDFTIGTCSSILALVWHGSHPRRRAGFVSHTGWHFADFCGSCSHPTLACPRKSAASESLRTGPSSSAGPLRTIWLWPRDGSWAGNLLRRASPTTGKATLTGNDGSRDQGQQRS